jgi:ubiquinone/menaquinone biosynthesis C-methylase UbiE
LYDQFAYDYDEFGDIKDYLGPENEFFQDIFRESNIQTVLDCACGTGHHVYMMAKMGLQASGSDYSASMLEMAKRNLSELEQEIKLRQCDFRYLENAFEEKFDAILCLTTSLPHFA